MIDIEGFRYKGFDRDREAVRELERLRKEVVIRALENGVGRVLVGSGIC